MQLGREEGEGETMTNALITMIGGKEILFPDYDRLMEALQEAEHTGAQFLFWQCGAIKVKQILCVEELNSFDEWEAECGREEVEKRKAEDLARE